jgi:hypothetical protein
MVYGNGDGKYSSLVHSELLPHLRHSLNGVIQHDCF